METKIRFVSGEISSQFSPVAGQKGGAAVLDVLALVVGLDAQQDVPHVLPHDQPAGDGVGTQNKQRECGNADHKSPLPHERKAPLVITLHYNSGRWKV